MSEPLGQDLTKHSSVPRDTKLASPKRLEEGDTVSEGSISEHITSPSGSVENDRSFQEIEILNQPSALEPKPDSLDLSSFGSYNGLPDSNDLVNSGTKHARSIMDEILNNSQFHSDVEGSKEDSFNVFGNLDLSDKSLINLSDNLKGHSALGSFDLSLGRQQALNDANDRLKQLEEIVAVKDTTITALSQELDSFRDMSNPTCNSSMVSATEYKQLQDECHAKLLEYNSAIAYKNDLIQQLSESLKESVTQQKELTEQVESFKEQISQLQQKLQETSKMVEDHKCALPEQVPAICSNTQETEIKDVQADFSTSTMQLEVEKKHAKEMEELRTYFEKKCAELEKNYSEEVFSQHSRKLSGSSSEVELSADYLLSSQPGPGGDQKRVFKCKEDVERLKENLANFSKKLAKHCLEDVSDKGLANIEIDVRTELNALFRIGEKLEIRAVESKYMEEISNLRFQLDEEVKRQGNLSMGSVVQEVVSSGDYELNEVVESYERRLQEQIAMAKIDILSSLQAQIQRLASNEADDENWPPDLLHIRDKFTHKYEAEIRDLKERHEADVARLKEEHLKILNGALERARRRSSRDGDTSELLKERDNLKKQVASQRNLLNELVKYCCEAEDELNNTLVENLLKQSNDQQAEEHDNSSGATTCNSSKIFDSLGNKTRVHFAPNFGELLGMIEQQSGQEDESLDVSGDLKYELGMCLEKLKQEANAILALTVQPRRVESGPASPSNATKEAQHNIRLKAEVTDANIIIASLEKEKETLEGRVEELLERLNAVETDLELARGKIADLVEGRSSEVVSEGYGEGGHPVTQGLEDTTAALVALQEKARVMLQRSRASVDPDVLQVIEELCRVSEMVKEEAKRETRDVLQQIEAADKKYKTTQKFLEEQAAERELERDEAQKKIDSLHEQLKERDKDRVNCQNMSKEADHLEQRIADLNNLLCDHQAKYKELESERDEAVDKIKIFRNIILELEQANDAKDRELEQQQLHLERLKCILNEQHASLTEFTSGTSLGDVSDVQNLRLRCEQLEDEVQKLRIGAELAGSEGALKQLKLQIFEVEASLDKKTRELEQLHSTGTNCSSPSEDMSVRDLVRPQTPSMDECEVPLQQLARLKEKLLRHSRAEQAAIKRIHDLEMEVSSLKGELDEVGNEKEVMKRQIQEQVVLLSDFQIRLDQQRIKAEHIEKQTNTSLETKIYDLQNELVRSQEKLRSKEKALAAQEHLVEELRQRVGELELELANPKEDELVVELQKELEAVRLQNQFLKEKPSSEGQILPNLMGNILQDKNSDIEKLKTRLAETERQLLGYTALNLDRNDLKTLAELKNSGTSIEQLISILDLSQPAVDRARHCVSDRSDVFQRSIPLRKNDDTEYMGSSSLPEISSIERVGQNLHYVSNTPLGKPNSTELSSHRFTEKRVRFEDTNPLNDSNSKELEALKLELTSKEQTIAELEAKLRALHDLESQIGQLQTRLDDTEAALVKATESFKKEKEDSSEKEQKLGVELAEKKLAIDRLEKEVRALRDDSARKDEMHLKLAREKRDLENQLVSQKRESFDSLDRALNEKDAEVQNFQMEQIRLKEELGKALSDLEVYKAETSRLLEENEQLLQGKFQLEAQVDRQINDMKVDLGNKDIVLQQLQDKRAQLEKVVEELQKQVQDKDDRIKDSACEIEILNDDLKDYQNEVADLTEKMKSYESSVAREQQQEKVHVAQLTKEVAHLQELVREKERVIAQMTEDHDVVRGQLKMIDQKMTEVGNVFDLKKRLKAEQKKNADLHVQVHQLKSALMKYDAAHAAPVDDITGQLKRELECAARIDSNIISAVSDQSLSSISEGQDAEAYMKALTRQKNQNKQLLRNSDRLEKQRLALEQQCSQFELKLNEMQNELEKERLHTKRTMIEDAKIMEQLRLKLDASVDFQKVLEKVLGEEKSCRRMLEIQLEELKKPSSSSESTKYKAQPTQDRLELGLMKKELDSVRDERQQLSKEVKALRLENDELRSSVKYTKEMLTLETERNKAQEEKFRLLVQKERSLSEELLKKRFELEVKEREMEERKIKMDELEQEKTVLKKQKSDLVKVLKTQAVPAPSPDGAVLPEQLSDLIRELKQKSDENKKRLEQIEKVEKEKAVLEKQLRNEVRKNVDGNMPYSDLVGRCDYLFAKSLKLESVRKALVWQKRYLGNIVNGYRTHFPIDGLPNQPHEDYCLRRRHSPLAYFRSAVLVVMSVERMKFLVRRWHEAKRKYDRINARHYQNSAERHLRENQVVNFRIGQPVSDQMFLQNVNRFSTNPFRQPEEFHATGDYSRPISPVLSALSIPREGPWTGQTPPAKDNHFHFRVGSPQTYAPLRAPELLTQLQERVEQVQERLSLPLRTDPT